MEMERLRQTHAKEVESRDEEVEEIRQSCQKKVGLARGPAAPWGSGYILGAAWAVVTQRSEPTRPLPSSSSPAGLTGPGHRVHIAQMGVTASGPAGHQRPWGTWWHTHSMPAPWLQPGSPRVTSGWT